MPACAVCGMPAALLDAGLGEPVCLEHVSPLDPVEQERLVKILRALDKAPRPRPALEQKPAANGSKAAEEPD